MELTVGKQELHKLKQITQRNNTRISLAFNTFYKGSVGSNTELTELIL
jgi:hypothetical protein